VPLYHEWAERAGIETRVAVCERVRGRVERRELSPAALLPLLTLDPDVRVTTRAAWGYAAFMPLRRSDPLTGPNEAVALLRLPSGPATRAGVFAALLAFGDVRVSRLLWVERDALADEELRLVSHCPADTLFEATVHFWVEWLEELPGDRDDSRFGLVAAALVNQVRAGGRAGVLRVQRIFPLNVSCPSMAELRRTPVARYLRGMRPRLAALAEREQGPRVVPAVIEAVDEAIREGQAADIAEGEALYRLAMRRGDPALALGVLEVLRNLDPDDPTHFINSAYCLHELGRTAEARELLLGGPAALLERPLYHYNLACYEAQLGDLARAQRRLARAVELQPDLAGCAPSDPDLAPLRLRVC
jgi:tetratricopeptide (TPR) repeat protein